MTATPWLVGVAAAFALLLLLAVAGFQSVLVQVVLGLIALGCVFTGLWILLRAASDTSDVTTLQTTTRTESGSCDERTVKTETAATTRPRPGPAPIGLLLVVLGILIALITPWRMTVGGPVPAKSDAGTPPAQVPGPDAGAR